MKILDNILFFIYRKITRRFFMSNKFIASSKLVSLIESATLAKAVTNGEKMRLNLALNEAKNGSEIYEEELLMAHEVLVRDAAKGGPAKSVTKKAKSKSNGNYVHGNVYTIDGIKKRYIGPKTKADGTQVKGYFMKVRA